MENVNYQDIMLDFLYDEEAREILEQLIIN